MMKFFRKIRRKPRNIILILVCSIALILVLLPTLIKSYVIRNSKELVGRTIDIDKLKYNYFTSTVKVYGFKMMEENEKDLFTSFDTLIINLEPYKFIAGTKSLEELYLKGLMVKIVIQDSTFNFDDLLTKFNTPEDSFNTKNNASEPFKYSLSNLQLKDANIFFDDKNVGKETHIEDFSFFIPFIGWDQKEKSNADVKFNLKKGGYIESSLKLNPIDGDFEALINIKDLYLEPFYEYTLEYANTNSLNGRLNSQISITGNTNDPVKSIVSGHTDVHDFVMTDTHNKKVLGAARVDCNFKKIDYYNSAFVIDSLKLFQPYAYFEMDSVTNNMFRVFKLYPEETEVDSTSNMYYAINHLNVNQGVLDYSDNLTGERFDYHLSDIKVDSDSILSDAKWITINSDMLLNNRGTLNAKLGLNPSDYTNLNLNLTIEKFLLSDINIYSQHYTGHSILLGDFYYYSRSKITNGNIVSENNLLVKNVEVQNNKNGLFSLPLKFALFILKDKNGDVNLEIPVRGDLNNPEISVWKIIWTTIKKRITGAATNPINSLATMVDVDPKDYEALAFEYTDTIPNESQKFKLDKLLEMETQKEGLKIELEQFVDSDLQRDAIVFSELGKQYYKDTQKDYKIDEKDFETYLNTKAGSESLNAKEAAYQLLKPASADSLTNGYNEKLIKNISDYLKTSKATTTIKVLKSDLKDSDNNGSISRFKIKFDMFESQSAQNDSIQKN